jgi:hypothetical protein
MTRCRYPLRAHASACDPQHASIPTNTVGVFAIYRSRLGSRESFICDHRRPSNVQADKDGIRSYPVDTAVVDDLLDQLDRCRLNF